MMIHSFIIHIVIVDLDKLALSTPQMAEYLKTIPTIGPLPTFTRNVNADDEEKQRMLEMWSNQAQMNFATTNNEIETNTSTATNIGGDHKSKNIKKGKH